eukprot:5534331-Heterocapsa_arctica.AAC.1
MGTARGQRVRSRGGHPSSAGFTTVPREPGGAGPPRRASQPVERVCPRRPVFGIGHHAGASPAGRVGRGFSMRSCP